MVYTKGAQNVPSPEQNFTNLSKESEKINNDQEPIQYQIPHPALKTKREITKYINSYLKFTKYVTNIIAEPKYKYGQQEQVIVRNHNR